MGLDKEIEKVLIEEAVKAREHSYSPYSKFKVGAALLTQNNRVYTGCNVENASYGATICAERGAAMTAIAAEGKTKFTAVAVATAEDNATPPCAMCRQFLSEFCDDDMDVILYSVTTKKVTRLTFKDILPYPFRNFEV